MRKTIISVVLGSLFVTSIVLAADWSTTGRVIQRLETTTNDGAYRVRLKVGHTATDINRHGCTDTGSTSFLEPHPNINTPIDIENVNKTLLSAFLAGRPVFFYMSTTECMQSNGTTTTGTTGRPTFTAVALE